MQHIIVSIVSFLALWVIFAFTGATVSLALLQAMVTSTLLGAVVFLHWKPRAWYKDHAMALAAVALVDVSSLAFYFGWTWTGWLFLLASIGCFIRYSCRWGNWCQEVEDWWVREGKAEFRAAAIVCHRKVRQGISWTVSKLGPWAGKHALPIFVAIVGFAAYCFYNGDRDWSKQSWWFYGATALFVLAFLIWSTYTRNVIGKLIVWFVGGLYRAYIGHYKGLSTMWQVGIWACVVAAGVHLWYLWYTHHMRGAWIAGFWIIPFIICHMGDGMEKVAKLTDAFKWIPEKDKKKKTKDEEKAEKRKESDLIKLIRKHRGEEGVEAYRRDKKAGKKFVW